MPKVKPLGFANAALIHTMGLSSEAAENLTTLVKNVADQYHENDSAMLKVLYKRLKSAARPKKTGAWAREVLEMLPERKPLGAR